MWPFVAMSKTCRSDFNKWLRLHVTFPVYISPTWCLVMKSISRVMNVFLRQTQVVGGTREPSDLKVLQGGDRVVSSCNFCIFFPLSSLRCGENKKVSRISMISSLCSHSSRWWGLRAGGSQRKVRESRWLSEHAALPSETLCFLLLHNRVTRTQRLKSTPISSA